MTMRSPTFWWKKEWTLSTCLLYPFSLIYTALVQRRLRRKGVKVSVPVICVGNFIVGGAGKTPTAIALAHMLHEQGYKCAFLSRGYGGRETGPVKVNTDQHTAQEVGDEPLLLSEHGLTIVSKDRVAGARFCEKLKVDLIIMDDGMQNPALHKDVVFSVLDTRGIGNGLCLPAGPLRAPVKNQSSLVDAVIAVDLVKEDFSIVQNEDLKNLIRFDAMIKPDKGAAEAVKGRRIVAFAGIGNPAKFYQTLFQSGALIEKTYDFADHHSYAMNEIQTIILDAQKKECAVVTTTKDFMRLKSMPGFDAIISQITVFPVALKISDERQLLQFLAKKLNKN